MIDRLLVGDGPSGGRSEIDKSIIGAMYLHFTVGRCIHHSSSSMNFF